MNIRTFYSDRFVSEKLAKENLEKLMQLDWGNFGAPRDEYFMSYIDRSYTYGQGRGVRTYESRPFDPRVAHLMETINKAMGAEFNVCFLNRYLDQKKWLGWHADDSPEMDQSHPIAVVSFGVERDIWWKPQDFKGEIPDEWKQTLGNGSLFVMPVGMQQTHYHKIPKHHSECGVRISLTFRKYKSEK